MAARGCRSWWGAPLRCSPADTPGCGTLWRAHWAGWSPPVASRRKAAARRAALRSPWPCGRWRRGWGAGASARWHCGPPLSWCQSQAELWALRRQRTQGELSRVAASRHWSPIQGWMVHFKVEIFLLLWTTPGGCVQERQGRRDVLVRFLNLARKDSLDHHFSFFLLIDKEIIHYSGFTVS